MFDDDLRHQPSAEAAAFLSRSHLLLIDGQWVAPRAGGTLPVFDPATEEQIATVAAAEAADVDLADDPNRHVRSL